MAGKMRWLGTFMMLALLLSSLTIMPAKKAQANDLGKWYSPYTQTITDKYGQELVVDTTPVKPPHVKMDAVELPEPAEGGATHVLTGVPAFTWVYGCSATSAGMMAGYYDQPANGYTNMYAGPTNGGVCPLNNEIYWGHTYYPIAEDVGECPLVATHQGYDSLATKGHVDDFWDDYGSTVDPYWGAWSQHPYADCTADYMGTNQYHNWDCNDGSTWFYYHSDNSPTYDYTAGETDPTPWRDGCHGLKLFFESRGYTVTSNYNQRIYGYNGIDAGFTYNDFKAQIDAGRPVFIQLAGHTMLGYGYSDPNTIAIHDTWDNSDHTMIWGETYGGMQHRGVTVIELAPPQLITVSPISGLVTTELGGTDTFTVVLNIQPTADVTIGLSSNDSTEGTVSPSSVTFNSTNWSTPQTLTVTGVDDSIYDGNISYSIITAPATSSDPNFNGLNASDVSVMNIDNDIPGITVTPTSGLVTNESGGTDTFTIVLNTQPTANVRIGLSSNDSTEGTVSPSFVNLGSANWSTPQTITVTGVDDALSDCIIAYTIVTAPATSADPNYNGINTSDVSAINKDNEVGICAYPTSGLVTNEGGSTATFIIMINTQPTNDVVVNLSSSDTSEGNVLPSSVTFNSTNWATPQTITVTGVDDDAADGDIAYSIVTDPATSTDPNYNGFNAADVSATNQDNDVAWITVYPSSGLVTTEPGGIDTFTIVLDTQPTADVVINLSSSDLTEGTVSPSSVTFNTTNWNTPQIVTVTGVDDAIVDGDIAYTIITDPASSADPDYNGLNAPDVSVINKDTPGITVNPSSGLVTTEFGDTDTFIIVLNTQPTSNVQITLSSSDTTEGNFSPAEVNFGATNWSTPQTVTVIGLDDYILDGDIAYTINTSAASSDDPNYNNMNAADVSVVNQDNDEAGITVNPTSGLMTTEAGGMANFSIMLNSSLEVGVDVVINLSSSDLTEGIISPTSVTFNSTNWNISQQITVTGVNDFEMDGDITYTIITAPATSTDPAYDTLNAPDVRVVNQDDDTAGINVYPPLYPFTYEYGSAAIFSVNLSSQPTAEVVINLISSDTTEGTVLPASLTFGTANWSTLQIVTVTSVDDALMDGDIEYAIVTNPASSADPNYNTRDAADVSITNVDDDTPGITVYPTSGLVTNESGGTANFNISLNSQPAADVLINLSSSDTTEGTVLPASLTFTTSNWNTTQLVTVTGVDDVIADGDIEYTIITDPANSSDLNYNGLNATNVKVINRDNESAGITVDPTLGLFTTESGGAASFIIVLRTQPTASVVVNLSSSDTTEGTISPASVTFTTGNWNINQTVTITGVNDYAVDGNINYTIITDPATSADPIYSAYNASDVKVTNIDNDVAGITVTPTSGLVTTEAGGVDTFTIVLDTQPSASVVINLTSSDTTEGTVSPASVTFTAANWNISRTVTVTGANDYVIDGPITYAIMTNPASSTDSNYNGLDAADVIVTNNDNDVAGITVHPTSGLITTEAGGIAAFTIVLDTQPSVSVSISMTSSDLTEGMVSPASVVFTAANWNVPQPIAVTGVNDFVMDGNVAYTIITAAATSSDPNYSGLDAADVSATNIDDDIAGINVNPTIGLVTTEAGGTAAFTIVLNSRPTASVTVGLSSSDLGEGTVSPASVTFTTTSWNIPQTVTITGVDDALMDGDIAYTIVTAPATSADLNYNGMNAADVSVINADYDTPGITVNPTAGLVTTETGDTATFTIVLRSPPTASVTISLSSSDLTEGTVSPASVTFTTTSWNITQLVTITGVDDLIYDGNVSYNIITAPASSTDPGYSNLNAADVSVTNIDDEAWITVNPTTGLVTTEAGGTATFTIVLETQPTGSVTIGLSSSDLTEGTVSLASLTFTTSNWNTPQTVTVTGVRDAEIDGDIAYTIITAPATSTDPNYSGLDAADVSVTNRDSSHGGAGGGGGGGGTTSPASNWELCIMGQCYKGVVNSLGTVMEEFWVASPDKGIIIYIEDYTKMTDADGKRLDGIWINLSESLPQPPAGHKVLAYYDLQPDGAQFDPPIRITIKFKAGELYPGQTVIAAYYYDEATGTWQFIQNQLIENSVTEDSQAVFLIDHFSDIAVMATEVTSTPPPEVITPPTPSTSSGSAGGLSLGAWIGIGICGFIIFIIAVWFLLGTLFGWKEQDTGKQ